MKRDAFSAKSERLITHGASIPQTGEGILSGSDCRATMVPMGGRALRPGMFPWNDRRRRRRSRVNPNFFKPASPFHESIGTHLSDFVPADCDGDKPGRTARLDGHIFCPAPRPEFDSGGGAGK